MMSAVMSDAQQLFQYLGISGPDEDDMQVDQNGDPQKKNTKIKADFAPSSYQRDNVEVQGCPSVHKSCGLGLPADCICVFCCCDSRRVWQVCSPFDASCVFKDMDMLEALWNHAFW